MTEKDWLGMILCSPGFTDCQSFDLQMPERPRQGHKVISTGYNGSYQERSTVLIHECSVIEGHCVRTPSR